MNFSKLNSFPTQLMHVPRQRLGVKTTTSTVHTVRWTVYPRRNSHVAVLLPLRLRLHSSSTATTSPFLLPKHNSHYTWTKNGALHGTYKGGTLRCWSHVCPENTKFLSVDLPGGEFGGGCTDEESATFKDFLKRNQSLELILADSHSVETITQVKTLLAGKPIDFYLSMGSFV